VNKLFEIVSRFRLRGTIKSIEPYGSGHIHNTYRVETIEDEYDNYILQGLNNSVFKNIEQLQKNICLVTSHIRKKLEEDDVTDINRRVLSPLASTDGNPYFRDEEGKYWRMYIFISKHRSYNIVESMQHASEAGRAIGRFQTQLSDLNSSLLHETIPLFHNIESRMDKFRKSVREDAAGRLGELKYEIEFVNRRSEEMNRLIRLGRAGLIPSRITHNDTKFNNILLDENDRALCVIDLDTVMPGYVHYDFGDAIRTSATRSAEDERDLEKVELDIDLFQAYTDAYLSEAASFLWDVEIQHLAFAPSLLTFTIGLRFLTDYLDGDRYFKIKRHEHNIDRARTQFKLVESYESMYKDMQNIISFLAEKYKKSRE